MSTENYRHESVEYVLQFFDDERSVTVAAIPVKTHTTSASGYECVELFESSSSTTDTVDLLALQHSAIIGRDAVCASGLVVPASVVRKFVAERLRDQLQFEIDNMPSEDLWSKFGGTLRVAETDPRVVDATRK